jgi:hypothetical protein
MRMSGSYSDASRERQPSPKRSGMGAWMSKFFRRAGASDGPEAGQAPAPMRLAPEPEKTLPPEEAMRKKELQAAMQAGTKTLPPEAEEPKAGGGQTDDEERVKGLLRILDGPVNSLYPFLRQQIQGCIGGTPNFISPEQASSTFKDPDNISHFMLSMRDVPYIYRQIKPVATAFQRFLNVYLKLHKAVAAQPMVWRQAENVEMQRRLDVRSFEKIMKDVEFLGYSINRVKMEKDFMGVMGYGTQVSMLLQEWERFNNLFQKAAPEIMNFCIICIRVSRTRNGIRQVHTLQRDQEARMMPSLGNWARVCWMIHHLRLTVGWIWERTIRTIEDMSEAAEVGRQIW